MADAIKASIARKEQLPKLRPKTLENSSLHGEAIGKAEV